MNRLKSYTRIAIIALYALTLAHAQTANPASPKTSAVPSLVRFSGTAKDIAGKPLNGMVGVTFSLYADEQSNAPLWSEIQNVQVDASGGYKVSLGASKALPLDLFASGEARWLGVQISGGAPEKRTLLLSVPYALKAGDAETIGGLPPSAFVLAAPANNSQVAAGVPFASLTSASAPPPASSNVTTTGGAVNTLPLFSTATNIQNSLLSQTGVTAINVGGKLNLPATGAATTVAGTKSRPQAFVASAFNSGTAAAVNQTFQWQAEPAGNNTSTPSGTMNLLFGSGAAFAAETGLRISNKGVFTFATGQTFPGAGTLTGITTTAPGGLAGGGTTGNLTLSLLKTCATNQVLQWNGTAWVCATSSTGTLTGITTAATSGLVGGGTTGNLTMSLLKTCATNQVLQWNGSAWVCATSGLGTITGVTAGTDLTGGGSGGNVTLNLNTAALQTANDVRYAQLGAANSFTQPIAIASTNQVGIRATSSAPSASVIYGHSTDTSGATSEGVLGIADGPTGLGVFGLSSGSAGIGVEGNGKMNGVLGFSTAVSSIWDANGTVGVHGDTGITNGIGVLGTVDGGYGVKGISDGTVLNTAGTYGAAGPPSGYGGIAGVWGDSANHVGTFGSSVNFSGVLGQSTLGNGVSGINSTGASGVSGINNEAGSGVYGETFGQFLHLGGGNVGVLGRAHSINAVGIVGSNDAPGGTGISGVAANGGFGFASESDVTQTRAMGGWVKAMVFVDPFTSNGTAITRCYNSQTFGPTVSTPPCGFSITHPNQGNDLIDFGFQVNDRFISATSFANLIIGTCILDPNNLCQTFGFFPVQPTANQVIIGTADTSNTLADGAFWIIIF